MRFGFSFPNEHGLVAIWSATLLFGLILGISDNLSIIGIIIAILFSFAIILSYSSIKILVNSKFKEINIGPLVNLILISLITFIWHVSLYSFFFFILLGLVVLMWMVLVLRQSRHTYAEIIVGSLALTLQYPIIYNSINKIDTIHLFLYILAVWWIYSGLVLVIIINVGCFRNKISHNRPLIIWIFYLLTFIPMFVLNYLEPIALVLMIEPTLRSIRQAIQKPTMKSMKMNIKKIGWGMAFSLFLFILLVLFFSISEIKLTSKF